MITKFKFNVVIFVLFALLGSMYASADDIDSKVASESLIAKLVKLKTFQADFVQFIVDKSGSTIQQTSGKLKARRPGLFYWYTAPPLEQYVKSDEKEIWVYDPDLEQVTVHKQSSEMSNTPAILLSGDVDALESSYHVTFKERSGIETYELTPLSEESLFEKLKLRFSEGVLVEMRLIDGLGQRSTLSFTGVVTNALLTNDDFSFSYPDDVDIIRE